MNSAVTPLLIVLVLAYAIYRQFKTRPADRSAVLYISLALIVFGLVSGGVLDSDYLGPSVFMLAIEVVTAVGLGVLRAMTVRIWADAKGVAWSKGTGWTLLAWLASIAVRVAEQFAGSAMGLTVAAGGIMVFVGLTLATQSLVVSSRGRALFGSGTGSYTVER
ncbi:hypothetical protein AB0K67_12125 [Nonomuraea sp. NPDC052634]|jgi:hypothetical protein|uniref:hypothetical protein n=1 Tax=Nonomuraea sp. NPDC052634 TaxID=3155813 RepID=UPI003431188C